MFSTLATFAVIAFAAATPVDNVALRQKFIDEINAVPGIAWRADHAERFKGEPIGVSKSLCGVKELDPEVHAKYALPSDAPVEGWEESGYTSVPEAFDSATNWPMCAKMIGDIRDQSNCGCCWAFGSAEAASDRMCIATQGKVMIPLSAEELCFCSNPNGCGGGFPLSAWQYIGTKGLVSGGQQGKGPFDDMGLCSDFSLPHCHHHGPVGKDPYPAEGTPGCPSQQSPQCPTKCDANAKAPHNNFMSDKYSYSGGAHILQNNDTAIQMEIMLRGPVTAAFTVYADFENYAGGIYHHVSGDVLGGHAVKIVGWGSEGGVDYWKVANSWNPYWGENGYFRIKRQDECGITGQCVASMAGAHWKPPSAMMEEF